MQCYILLWRPSCMRALWTLCSMILAMCTLSYYTLSTGMHACIRTYSSTHCSMLQWQEGGYGVRVATHIVVHSSTHHHPHHPTRAQYYCYMGRKEDMVVRATTCYAPCVVLHTHTRLVLHTKTASIPLHGPIAYEEDEGTSLQMVWILSHTNARRIGCGYHAPWFITMYHVEPTCLL